MHRIRLGSLVAGACLAVGSLSVAPARAESGPVSVLTTTTDLASIVRAVGGNLVTVESLCHGPEDPHFLDARPSFLQMAHRAEMLVFVGMELEAGYLPLLLRDASNARIRPGGSGHLDASARIRKLQVPEGGTASRALGDVHPGGNPHYLMDPANAGIVAEDVARRLTELRPEGKATFDAGAKALRDAISELVLGAPPKDDPQGKRTGGLRERFRPLKGAGVVSYHDDMLYLAVRLGLDVVGTLEPKPGVPPTASHIASLAERAKASGVKAVLYEVFQPKGPVDALASGIGAKPVLMAHQPGATADAPDLLAMYRRNADALYAALSAALPAPATSGEK